MSNLKTVIQETLDGMWNAHVDYSTSTDFEPRTEAKHVQVKANWIEKYTETLLKATQDYTRSVGEALVGSDDVIKERNYVLDECADDWEKGRNDLRASQRNKLEQILNNA